MSKVSFCLSAKESKKLLKPLFSVINNTTVIPILEDILIEHRGNVISFTATDLETVAGININGQVNGEYQLCLEARILKKILSDSLSKEVKFSGDLVKLGITSDEFKMKVTPDPYGQFPATRLPPSGVHSFKISSVQIIPLLKKALHFVSNDDLRPAMTGVYLVDYNNELHIVATDASRLYWEGAIKTPNEFKGGKMIIPAKTIMAVIEMFSTEEMDIQFNETHVWFMAANKYVSSRIIEMRYPDFTVVLPKDNALTFYLQRKKFFAFLKLAQEFTNKFTHQLSIKVTKLTLMAYVDQSYESSNAAFEYKIPVFNPSTDFEEFTIDLNAMYLTEVVSLSKDEYIKIDHPMNPQKPIVIDDHFIVMPLITNR